MADTSPFRGFRGFNTPNNTQVPDELFDELLVHLSGAELKVLLYIIRRTYGFKRESDNISLSQMLTGIVKRDGVRLDYGTGLSKPTLLTALRTLAEKHLIVPERRRSSEHGDQATTYRLHFVNDEQTNGGPPKGGNTEENETDPVVKKFDQGEEGNLTTPVAKELNQAVVKKSAPQVTGDNNQGHKVVNVTANDHENPSKGRTPDGKRTPVISKAGLRSKYQLTDDQISRVFWLVEKQATTLGAIERNHAHYVKRAAESVRDGIDNLLDLTLGDFKQAATDIAVGTKPAYFHSMWLEALEQHTTAASSPHVSSSSAPTRTSGPQPVGDLFRRPEETGAEDSRTRMIADAERRGLPIPAYIRTADTTAVNRWWAALPETSTSTRL